MEQVVDARPRRDPRRAYSPGHPLPRAVARDRVREARDPVTVAELGVPDTATSAPLPAEVATVLAVERHAVAMTFATFLVTLAAALLYQGAAAGTTSGGLFYAGMATFAVAGTVAFWARLRLRARLRAAAQSAARSRGTI